MKNTSEKLKWIFDYYVVYFLYNPQKIGRYYLYMHEKWNIDQGSLPHHLKHSTEKKDNPIN